MNITAKEIQKLKDAVSIINGSLTKEEFVDSFKNVIDLVLRLEKKLIEKIDSKTDMATQDMEAIKAELTSSIDAIKYRVEKELGKEIETLSLKESKLVKLVNTKLKEIDTKLSEIKDGEDADETLITEKITNNLKVLIPKETLPETPEQARDKLETLKEEKRLDKSAVKGIEDIEERINKIEIRPLGKTAGAKGIGLYVNGIKKLATAQTINLIGGTGVTLVYSNAYGRNDITISASGSALSLLTVTGTIDDNNVAFTTVSTAQVVVVNGASYKHGGGCTISGNNITLDNPVGTGGNIYAIG